jgi:hypothetical protein
MIFIMALGDVTGNSYGLINQIPFEGLINRRIRTNSRIFFSNKSLIKLIEKLFLRRYFFFGGDHKES